MHYMYAGLFPDFHSADLVKNKGMHDIIQCNIDIHLKLKL